MGVRKRIFATGGVHEGTSVTRGRCVAAGCLVEGWGLGIKKPPGLAVAKSGNCLFKWRLPTLPRKVRSTIGAGGLNFSVRDGKRWGPAAIAA